jgi:hypothetical protein
MADGRWLALGAVAAVAAAGAVRRARVGSRVETYRKAEVDDLYEALRGFRGHHGYEKSNDYKDAYQFNIKAHHAQPPKEVEQTLPDEWIWENIAEYAQIDLEEFVERLREGYPWISDDYDIAGSSDGYLILYDSERVMSDLPYLETTVVRRSFRGQIPTYRAESIEQADEAIEKAKQRLLDLEAIQLRVKEAVAGFEQWMGQMEPWEDTLERWEEVREQEEDEEDDDG